MTRKRQVGMEEMRNSRPRHGSSIPRGVQRSCFASWRERDGERWRDLRREDVEKLTLDAADIALTRVWYSLRSALDLCSLRAILASEDGLAWGVGELKFGGEELARRARFGRGFIACGDVR